MLVSSNLSSSSPALDTHLSCCTTFWSLGVTSGGGPRRSLYLKSGGGGLMWCLEWGVGLYDTTVGKRILAATQYINYFTNRLMNKDNGLEWKWIVEYEQFALKKKNNIILANGHQLPTCRGLFPQLTLSVGKGRQSHIQNAEHSGNVAQI
jgi:hypothetical protein